jgi:transposase
MVTIGIDAHKRTHTLVAVDEQGRELAQTTIGTTSRDHLALLEWAARLGAEREWAVEDCRHLSRRLERDLLGAGEQLRRVPPKLMAQARNGARTYGKSDPIDALAVARAALREEHLPVARLDGEEREIRLLVDHRDDLVQERTRVICRLRWHLHDLDPALEPRRQALSTNAALDRLETHLAAVSGTLARIARDLVARCRELTIAVRELDRELAVRTATLVPTLLQVPGCGVLTAAKIVAETADIRRFRSDNAYARHNGTAPLPVWSSGTTRHRLSRSGNRQLNAALHRIAITQARVHPAARTMLERLQSAGKSRREAIRILKRRLSDVVYRTLLTDAP